jgi:hypothetical protein
MIGSVRVSKRLDPCGWLCRWNGRRGPWAQIPLEGQLFHFLHDSSGMY